MNSPEAVFDATVYLALRDAINIQLSRHEKGISEFELLKSLEQQAEFGGLFCDRINNHDLFRSHFLLFHCLYRLRDEWLLQQTAWLEISALNIQRHPYEAGEQSITEHDALRDYYLDLTHLSETSAEDVDKLISNFWQRYMSHERRDEALEILGLIDPVDDETIKQTYRKLVMQHHPDRGGDKLRLQTINEAVAILLN